MSQKGRLLLSGLAAGSLLCVGEVIINRFILGLEWEASLLALGLQPASSLAGVLFVAATLFLGLAMAWLYSALYPGYQQGTATALRTALFFWLTVFLYSSFWLGLLGIFPIRLLILGTVWGLGECTLAALLISRIQKGRR